MAFRFMPQTPYQSRVAQRKRDLFARRRGALQPVVDRLAQARDAGSAPRQCAPPLASSSCSIANRFRAASCRSPAGDRLSVGRRRRPEAEIGLSPSRGASASSRIGARAHSGSPASPAPAPPRPSSATATVPPDRRLDHRRASAPARSCVTVSPLDREDGRLDARAWHGPPSSTGTLALESPHHLLGRRRRQLPDGLADGAASGTPAARISSSASGWSGTRMPTVSSPAVTISLSSASGRRGSTSVSGPGQNCPPAAAPAAKTRHRPRPSARSATCTISGLKRGRPLVS